MDMGELFVEEVVINAQRCSVPLQVPMEVTDCVPVCCWKDTSRFGLGIARVFVQA